MVSLESAFHKLHLQFRLSRLYYISAHDDDVEEPQSNDVFDPISLLTHVIGSDVHFGHQTLQPLSSVIAAIKHRNPMVQVIIMLKERSEDGAADLVKEHEKKLQEGHDDEESRQSDTSFTVHVRDVIESGEPELQMKLVEC